MDYRELQNIVTTCQRASGDLCPPKKCAGLEAAATFFLYSQFDRSNYKGRNPARPPFGQRNVAIICEEQLGQPENTPQRMISIVVHGKLSQVILSLGLHRGGRWRDESLHRIRTASDLPVDGLWLALELNHQLLSGLFLADWQRGAVGQRSSHS